MSCQTVEYEFEDEQYTCDSVSGYLDVTDPDDHKYIVKEISEHHFNAHDGWEYMYSRSVEIGFGGRKYSVCTEAEPSFSISEVSNG